jgi:RNA polymerase sigma-70 factor (ECF subfamily)
MSNGIPEKEHQEDMSALRPVVEEFKAGNAAAFQTLYRKYSSSIYRFCLRMLGESAYAQDALQETFMKAYEHRSEFRGEHFPAWIFMIARRVCLNIIRSRRQFDTFDEDFHGFEQKTVMPDIGMQQCVQQALLMLPVTLREAAILREYEGYSYQEIAGIVGIDISLAKVRVHRARLMLRKILAPVMQEWYDA